MRVRAMDNQLCLVVARNAGAGSCIVDRSGAILAYQDGGSDYISAVVDREAPFRMWNGGCFRDDAYTLRRPIAFEPLCDPLRYCPDPAPARMESAACAK